MKEQKDFKMPRAFDDEERKKKQHDFKMPRTFDDEERKKKQHDFKMLGTFEDEEERNGKLHCEKAMTMAKPQKSWCHSSLQHPC